MNTRIVIPPLPADLASKQKYLPIFMYLRYNCRYYKHQTGEAHAWPK